MKLELSPTLKTFFKDQNPFKAVRALKGKIYRELEGRRTLSFAINNKNYFAKIHLGIGWKEIIKNLSQLRLPIFGAENEWRAIKRLQQLGIKTMTLIGYGKQGLNPAKQESFIVTEALENTISLEDLCANWKKNPPSLKQKRNLLNQIAKIAHDLHYNGVNHRDFYLCHFLKDNHDQLFLIDLHRTQIRKRAPERWIIKDLSGLYFSAMDIGLTKRDILRFIKLYTQQPLTIVLANQAFWQRVNARSIKLYLKTFDQQPELVLS